MDGIEQFVADARQLLAKQREKHVYRSEDDIAYEQALYQALTLLAGSHAAAKASIADWRMEADMQKAYCEQLARAIHAAGLIVHDHGNGEVWLEPRTSAKNPGPPAAADSAVPGDPGTAQPVEPEKKLTQTAPGDAPIAICRCGRCYGS